MAHRGHDRTPAGNTRSGLGSTRASGGELPGTPRPRENTSEGGSVGTAFRTDIQGLRAIAVLLVLVYHLEFDVLGGGFIGVDVFFVISGFLITTHLVQSMEKSSLSLSGFYARRARRLLPASFAVLLVTVFVAVVWFPPLVKPQVLVDAAATAAYVPNILFAWQGTDYLSDDIPSVFQHYWSLGVEEQFYLVWPLLLLAAYRIGRRSRRVVFFVVLAVALLSFVAGVWFTEWRQPLAFFLLPTRAWELAVGALVALFVLSGRMRLTAPWLNDLLAWLGVCGIVLAGVAFSASTPFPSWFAALPVLATAAVIFGGSAPGRLGPRAALSIPPLLFLGKISYSLYLVHWPLVITAQTIAGWNRALSPWAMLLLGVLSVGLAWLSWRFIEEPGRRDSRWWATSPRRSLLTAALASLTIVILALVGSRWMSQTPLASSQDAQPTMLSQPPSQTAFVPANLTPSLRQASQDNARVYEDGCHRDFNSTDPTGCRYGESGPVVALFGDSHAASWFPAFARLAEEGHLILDYNSKNACASADLDQTLESGVQYESCNTWREGVLERLRAEPPDIVVLTNFVAAHLDPDQPWDVALGRVRLSGGLSLRCDDQLSLV